MKLNSSNRKQRVFCCLFAMIMAFMLVSKIDYAYVHADDFSNDVSVVETTSEYIGFSDIIRPILSEINPIVTDFAKMTRLSVRVEQDDVKFAELLDARLAEAERKAAEQAARQYSISSSGISSGNGAYVGRWVIPSVGVNVACYASNSQATVDASDSAAYYRGYGHTIIGDHTNQGFNAIKSCNVGTTAYLDTGNGIVGYTCVGKVMGHNTGDALTDNDYNRIDYLYPGALVCYTCNDNWTNVTLVFFMPDNGTDYHVNKETGEIIDPDEMSDEWKFENVPACEVHTWRDWVVVEESRVDYPGTKKRTCDVCGDWEYGTIPKLEPEYTEPVETEPFVTAPSEPECDETVPDETESVESVDVTEPVVEPTDSVVTESSEESTETSESQE